jgi:glycosyltransferase involved in cell wall biosynthesis
MLKEHARELGIEENVVFTGQRSDVALLLAVCDVFSLPSFDEPFGLVFAEAMAMKRPAVAFTSGGTPEVVQHGRCSLLSTGDIDAQSATAVGQPCATRLIWRAWSPAGRAAFHVAAHGVRFCRARVLERSGLLSGPYWAAPAAYRRTERTNK